MWDIRKTVVVLHNFIKSLVDVESHWPVRWLGFSALRPWSKELSDYLPANLSQWLQLTVYELSPMTVLNPFMHSSRLFVNVYFKLCGFQSFAMGKIILWHCCECVCLRPTPSMKWVGQCVFWFVIPQTHFKWITSTCHVLTITSVCSHCLHRESSACSPTLIGAAGPTSQH